MPRRARLHIVRIVPLEPKEPESVDRCAGVEHVLAITPLGLSPIQNILDVRARHLILVAGPTSVVKVDAIGRLGVFPGLVPGIDAGNVHKLSVPETVLSGHNQAVRRYPDRQASGPISR